MGPVRCASGPEAVVHSDRDLSMAAMQYLLSSDLLRPKFKSLWTMTLGYFSTALSICKVNISNCCYDSLLFSSGNQVL
jgi:hypothetical protein